MRIKMKIFFIYFKVEGDFHIKIGSRGKLKITLVSGAENGFGKKNFEYLKNSRSYSRE